VPSTTLLFGCVTVALVLSPGIQPAGAAAEQAEPLSCVPAARTDNAPWIWRTRILQSFPPDTPRPQFVGGFGDSHSEYELHLWRDSKGMFGQLLSPVLEADSPTSRLYDPRFDTKTGAVSFTVRFTDGEWQFSGRLRSDSVTGAVVSAARTQRVVLRKLREGRVHGAGHDSYTSRAQFDCAMILFRRY
jgi:hypothetical protein